MFRAGRPVSTRERGSTAVPDRLAYWNLHTVPIHGRDGQVEGVIVLGQEVTEWVAVSEQMEELQG